MITRTSFLVCAALITLTGCQTVEPDAFQLPAKPADLLIPPPQEDMYERMAIAVNNAQGLNEAWLMDYALEAQQDRLQLMATQNFINRVWSR